ncbi:MAG: hypothetical protein E7388_07520 [Ruminococcaceae bacterium]|nr:hypothetical protein [Oscillospiraceae bacterium]
MAENNEQRPQGQRNPEKKGNYNRNRNYQNRNRNHNKSQSQQNQQGQQSRPVNHSELKDAQAKETKPNQSNPNKGGHKNFNKNKNYSNRFEGKKIQHVETVEDIKSDMARIEKEIELEIAEIGAMTLG